MTVPFHSHGEDTGARWAEIVGPCYTAATIVRVLGCTEREVADAAKSLRLLAVRTSLQERRLHSRRGFHRLRAPR